MTTMNGSHHTHTTLSQDSYHVTPWPLPLSTRPLYFHHQYINTSGTTTMTNGPHHTHNHPPLRDSHYIKPWSPPLSTHPPTIARLNGARPEPQIMYVFLSFFSLFFRLLMIFLHVDYMYRVDDDNERPPHRTHNPLSGQPPHYTMHHHVTPWHYHRQRVHPHEKTN